MTASQVGRFESSFTEIMCIQQAFKVDLRDIKERSSHFDYPLSDEFFNTVIGSEDIRRGNLVASLDIEKIKSAFELKFHINGTVHIPCDICLDDMEQAIDTDNTVVVRLGEEYSDGGDEITVDEADGTLDVARLIYEFIYLAIPVRHVHAPGKCDPAMLKLLNEHSGARSEGGDDDMIDTRWSALKKIKNNIKD